MTSPNKILEQCEPDADVLLDNFRKDISCEVLNKFKALGITLKNLMDLQLVIPVVYPWDKEYDELKYNVNRRFIVFPWAIAMCKTTKHVEIAVDWCYNRNVPLIARSGSHCFENFSLINGMIIDQSRRTDIQVLEKDNIAIVESGCLLGPTQLELSKHELALVGGTCCNVACSGLSLGGGIGFLARKYGLASDNLLEAEVVLYNGKTVKANCKENTDLFWALRGAGNCNYGIVTEFVFKVYKIPTVTIFDLIFPYNQMKEVIDVWQRWAPFTDENLTSECDVYNNRVLVTGQYIGCKKDLEKLLLPIFKLCPKECNIKTVSFIDACRHFTSKPWHPFFKNKSGFVKQFLPSNAIDIIHKYMKCGGDQDHVELNAFGKNINKVPSNKTAFPHREGTLFWCHLQCHWSNQEHSKKKLKWINNFYNEIEPYLSGAYANAPDIDLIDPLEKYYGDNLSRLMEIKRKYDPENVFKYAQSVPV